MDIANEIKDSKELVQWISSHIDGTDIKSDDRSLLAAGCLDMALEHHNSIVILTGYRLYGSAAALIRLIFEAYVRGVWLYYSATEDELNKFKNDKLKKHFYEIIEDLEKHEAFSEGTISHVKKLSWKTMNSATHSGFYQVLRRNTENEIAPNYSKEDIVNALESANSFAILTAIAISDIANNTQLANTVYKYGMEYFKKSPNNPLNQDAQ